MHCFSWADIAGEPKYASEYERLLAEADALDREAERLKGTCFYGDISPSKAGSRIFAECDSSCDDPMCPYIH